MKAMLISFVVSACSVQCSLAQLPSIEEQQPFLSQKPLDLQGHPFMWKEVVTNHSSSAIIALQANFNCPTKGYYKMMSYNSLHDCLISRGDKDVPPGGSIELQAHDPAQCSGKVDAAIFSDGHSEGDPEGIKQLYMRRLGAFEMITDIIPQLDRVANNTETLEEALTYLQERDVANGVDQKRNITERSGMSIAIGYARSYLTPSGDDYRVTSLMRDTTLKLSREQALAITLRDRLTQWRTDLEGHTKPLSE